MIKIILQTLYLLLISFLFSPSVVANTMSPLVLRTYVWRDFQPGSTEGNDTIMVSVDVYCPLGKTPETTPRVESVEVIRLKNKEKINEKLRYGYEIVQGDPLKGSRYFSLNTKVRWPVGEEVQIKVIIRANGNIIIFPMPKIKIEATH